MTDVDPELRALLQLAKEGMSPQRDDERRVWSGLEGALAPGGLEEIPRGPGDKVLEVNSLRSTLAGLVVGLGAGGLLGYHLAPRSADEPTPRVGAVHQVGGSSDAAGPPGVVSQQSAGVVRKPGVSVGPSQSAPSAQSKPQPPAGRRDAGLAKPHHASERTSAPAAPDRNALPPAELDEVPIDEVEQVRQVQRALARGDAASALRLLSALDARVPDGRLREERAAGRAIAQCILEPARGPWEVAEFVRRYRSSIHEARVRAVCIKGG